MPSRHVVTAAELIDFKDRYNRIVAQHENVFDEELREILKEINKVSTLATVFSCAGFGAINHNDKEQDFSITFVGSWLGIKTVFDFFTALEEAVEEASIDDGFKLKLTLAKAAHLWPGKVVHWGAYSETYKTIEIRYACSDVEKKKKFLEIFSKLVPVYFKD